MKYSFILPDELVVPGNYDPYYGDEEFQAKFVPDIQEWIDENMPTPKTRSKNPPLPRVYLYYYDAIEFEHPGPSFWMVEFKTEADKMFFKLKWSDDPRFIAFRKLREAQKLRKIEDDKLRAKFGLNK